VVCQVTSTFDGRSIASLIRPVDGAGPEAAPEIMSRRGAVYGRRPATCKMIGWFGRGATRGRAATRAPTARRLLDWRLSSGGIDAAWQEAVRVGPATLVRDSLMHGSQTAFCTGNPRPGATPQGACWFQPRCGVGDCALIIRTAVLALGLTPHALSPAVARACGSRSEPQNNYAWCSVGRLPLASSP
jgi:hypothetical protein